MTTAPAWPATARPPKPRRSLVLPLGVVGFLVITWVSLSAEYGIGLNVERLIDNFASGRHILAELLSPNWAFWPRTIAPMLETFQMAVIAGLIGCAVALPISFLASRVTSPNRGVLLVDRGILNVVRSIPDILYALIFVAAAGIGPLPGILALIFFNVGVVAKLLSETIDGIDSGPLEAARATGATRTQTVRWAALPQVLPNYIAYSLYTFELNIRASTVIGIVGAGGIGQLLIGQYRLFNWSNVSVIIVELFVIVFVIEIISITLRRRLV